MIFKANTFNFEHPGSSAGPRPIAYTALQQECPSHPEDLLRPQSLSWGEKEESGPFQKDQLFRSLRIQRLVRRKGAAKAEEGALPKMKAAALRGTHRRPLKTPGRPQHPRRPAQPFVLRSPV